MSNMDGNYNKILQKCGIPTYSINIGRLTISGFSMFWFYIVLESTSSVEKYVVRLYLPTSCSLHIY